MEKSETKTVETGVKRQDVLTGVVTLIKEVDKTHKFNDNERPIILSEDGTKRVVALDIRKIVFEEKNGYGTDIFFKLNTKDDYTYKIMNPNEQPKNNTIVIRDVRELNNVLLYAGYPKNIDHSMLGSIKKTVLSNDEFLNIKKHSVRLEYCGIVYQDRIQEINGEARGLLEFKQINLPVKPQKKEKVYLKHFK